MNRLDTARRTHVLRCLVEGMSLRGTARVTGVARMTIEKLLRDLGPACMSHHDATVRNLKSERIQADEIWSFIGAKAKNVPEDKRDVWGDCWTWTALDPDSKLMVSYAVGPRNADMAYDFMQDVADRLTKRIQLTTDGLKLYLNAVEYAFGSAIDYAIIDKHYSTNKTAESAAVRYSPAKFTKCTRKCVQGEPDAGHISTSHVERSNLTMRMHMRRFTRLTNGFSKKVEMHAAAVALHFAYYNFCKIHQTLRVTPAMAAGLATHPWELSELVALLDRQQSAPSD